MAKQVQHDRLLFLLVFGQNPLFPFFKGESIVYTPLWKKGTERFLKCFLKQFPKNPIIGQI